jgi:tRNA-specific 2-thiouridylase
MNAPTRERIAVGLSGGVDSAVAALLLRERGFDVVGLFMKNWEEDDAEGYCAAADDLDAARSVCRRLDIPLHTVNFAAEYWDRVFERFLDEYRAGRTPNPDVLCNREIKFSAFIEHAATLGASRIATGHYAQLGRDAQGLHLLRARDASKDQTYFLHLLDQRALARSVFPLGGLLKSEVRRIARDAALPNHARKDSTGICFIGERRFAEFLRRYVNERAGDIVSVDGRLLGTHRGLPFYTVGQRQGLGVGGPGAAWYVVAKDVAGNRLVVAQGADHPALYSRGLQAGPLHWISGRAPAADFDCTASIRHRQAPEPCTVRLTNPARAELDFRTPQRAVTPGQSVVLYRDGECLGGGVIERAEPHSHAADGAGSAQRRVASQ